MQNPCSEQAKSEQKRLFDAFKWVKARFEESQNPSFVVVKEPPFGLGNRALRLDLLAGELCLQTQLFILEFSKSKLASAAKRVHSCGSKKASRELAWDYECNDFAALCRVYESCETSDKAQSLGEGL